MKRRTKKLTQKRALEILQLRFGTQVYKVSLENHFYIINDGHSIFIWEKGSANKFTKGQILKYENEMYSNLGA